jgi:hypothetical protein
MMHVASHMCWLCARQEHNVQAVPHWPMCWLHCTAVAIHEHVMRIMKQAWSELH